MSDYAVDLDELHSDASKWGDWADQLAAIDEVVPDYADADMFGYVVGVAHVREQFEAGLKTLKAYIVSGNKEFEGISAALHATVDIYDGNDSSLSVDASMFGKRTGLL